MNIDISNMIESYRRKWKASATAPEALGWGSSGERYSIRRKTTLDGINLMGGFKDGDAILDVGSGPGLGCYINQAHKSGMKYIAIDVIPEFIECIKVSMPEAETICADILEMDSFPECDWAICDEVFNFKWSYLDNFQEAMKCMNKMFMAARKGVIMSFMGDEVDFKEDYLYYFNAVEVFKYSKILSRRVNLRYSAPVFEFWIDLYPNFKGWRNG